MQWAAGVLAAAVALSALAGDRSRAVRSEFQRLNPCPETGAKRGACRGWEVDHIVPLCAGGADRVENLQWLTVHEHRRKTKRDVARCRRKG